MKTMQTKFSFCGKLIPIFIHTVVLIYITRSCIYTITADEGSMHISTKHLLKDLSVSSCTVFLPINAAAFVFFCVCGFWCGASSRAVFITLGWKVM